MFNEIWILIPLLALLVGAFTEWLSFKSKQEKIGISTHDLERTVEELQQALSASEDERKRVVQRLQNVEAIVTSEAWDALHSGEQTPLLEKTDPAAPAASDAERTARLARRLNGT